VNKRDGRICMMSLISDVHVRLLCYSAFLDSIYHISCLLQYCSLCVLMQCIFNTSTTYLPASTICCGLEASSLKIRLQCFEGNPRVARTRFSKQCRVCRMPTNTYIHSLKPCYRALASMVSTPYNDQAVCLACLCVASGYFAISCMYCILRLFS